MALFFHFLFRLLAVLVYILGNFLFASSFALSFVVIILLLAFDFWTVKNISGRLLVGLRWWSQMKSDGTEEWIFESRQVYIPHFLFPFFLENFARIHHNAMSLVFVMLTMAPYLHRHVWVWILYTFL